MTREVSELAMQHLIQKLQGQQDYLVALRNQAGISAAVTGLIAGVFANFLGNNVDLLFSNEFLGFSILGILALLAFSASIAFSVMVLVHFSVFTFAFDVEKMLNFGVENDLEKFYSTYIKDGEFFFKENEDKIAQAQNKLLFAMVFGFVQIIPWVIMVGGIK